MPRASSALSQKRVVPSYSIRVRNSHCPRTGLCGYSSGHDYYVVLAARDEDVVDQDAVEGEPSRFKFGSGGLALGFLGSG